MDLNYLYQRHGVSLILAERAACERSRSAHLLFAAAYANDIAREVNRTPEFPE